jgi:hypothetical protein
MGLSTSVDNAIHSAPTGAGRDRITRGAACLLGDRDAAIDRSLTLQASGPRIRLGATRTLRDLVVCRCAFFWIRDQPVTLDRTVSFGDASGVSQQGTFKTALDAKRHPGILGFRMNVAGAPGSFVSAHAAHRGPAPASQAFVVDALLGRLAGVRDGVVVALPLVGLLVLVLVLIIAGCGPPN